METQTKKKFGFFRVLFLPITALKHLWYRWLMLILFVFGQAVYVTLVVINKTDYFKNIEISLFWLLTSYISLMILILGFSIAFTISNRRNVVEGK